jgi:hypothetical protein
VVSPPALVVLSGVAEKVIASMERCRLVDEACRHPHARRPPHETEHTVG